jgi:hypothetical protein
MTISLRDCNAKREELLSITCLHIIPTSTEMRSSIKWASEADRGKFDACCSASRTGTVWRGYSIPGKLLFEELKLGSACTKTLTNPRTHSEIIPSEHSLAVEELCYV